MAVALTAYLTNVTSTTLATAKKLQATAPGAEGNPTTKVAKVTGWGEIYAFGTANNWAGVGAEPAASGNGFLLDDNSLVGQSILAGTWSPTLKIASSQSGITITVNVRAWKRTSGGVYTLIAKYSRAGWALTTTAVVNPINTVVQAGVLTSFATGDKLYIDIVANVTTNTANSNTLTIVFYENGGANEAVVTPGYQLTTLTPAPATLTLTRGTPFIPFNSGPVTVTPAAAVLTMSPRPLDDPALQGVWFQEDYTNAATRLDSSDKGNTLTQVNLVGQTAESRQGLYSASFERGRVALLNRTDANLSANFPGKSTATTKDFTVGCWVLIDVLGADNMWAMNKGTDGAFALYYHSGLQRFFGEINDGGSYTGARSWQVTPSTLTWYHIVMRVKGNTSKEVALFVNGVKQTPTEVAVNATLVTDTGDFAIGAFAGGNHYWDGLIDECFIYSRALPDEEIKAIYALGIDGTPPLIRMGSTLTPAPAVLTLTRGTPTVTGGAAFSGYRYSRLLTVDHTKVAANLTNFAVLVTVTSASLKSAANGGKILNTVTQSGGAAITIPADLVFSSDSAGSTKYPWEVESYDPVNGVLVAWVKPPSISASVDTLFYMAFSNGAVTTQQNTGTLAPSAVWDANFKAVWHLANSATPGDSTTSGFTLTNNNGATAAPGIGSGMSFDGTTQSLSIVAAIADGPSDFFTVEAWVKPASTTAGGRNIMTSGLVGPNGYNIQLRRDGANYDLYVFNQNGIDVGASYAGGVSAGSWQHIAGMWGGTTITLYVDGVAQASAPLGTATRRRTGTTLAWGADKSDYAGDGGQFWDGLLDELRVSNIPRSGSWIQTEYNSQIAPGNIGTPGFITYGAEVDAAPSGTTLQPTARALTITRGTPTVVATVTVTVSPTVRALTITRATPTLKTDIRVAPASRALVLTGVAPSLKTTIRVSPSPALITLTGLTPSLKTTIRVSPTSRPLVLTSQTPTLKSTVRLSPTSRSLNLTTLTPTLTTAIRVSPTSQPLTLTGLTPTLKSTIRVSPTVRALTITPVTPTLRTITVLTPAARALVITRGTPNLGSGWFPLKATLTLTGSVPKLSLSVRPTSTVLALTRLTPVVKQATTLRPAPAVLALSGTTPTLKLVVRPTAKALSITGNTPVLVMPVALFPAPASLVITRKTPAVVLGNNITLQPNLRSLVLTQGTPTIKLVVGVRRQPVATIA